MLKTKIISVGKIKSKDLKSLILEYEKRMSRYTKVEAIEIDDLAVNDNPSENEINTVLLKEGKEILKKINEKAYIISLCIEGNKIDSKKLADKISDISQSYSEIDFIIGSSHGLCDEVKKRSHLRLSMSDMTFPHNIAKLMLTEQIYRAFKIINNESYHK